jgi:hypothetical protein
MIDAPQKADGKWLYLNFHCHPIHPSRIILITNLVFNRNIPLAQSEPTSVRKQAKWLTTVNAGLPRPSRPFIDPHRL